MPATNIYLLKFSPVGSETILVNSRNQKLEMINFDDDKNDLKKLLSTSHLTQASLNCDINLSLEIYITKLITVAAFNLNFKFTDIC